MKGTTRISLEDTALDRQQKEEKARERKKERERSVLYRVAKGTHERPRCSNFAKSGAGDGALKGVQGRYRWSA